MPLHDQIKVDRQLQGVSEGVSQGYSIMGRHKQLLYGMSEGAHMAW